MSKWFFQKVVQNIRRSCGAFSVRITISHTEYPIVHQPKLTTANLYTTHKRQYAYLQGFLYASELLQTQGSAFTRQRSLAQPQHRPLLIAYELGVADPTQLGQADRDRPRRAR